MLHPHLIWRPLWGHHLSHRQLQTRQPSPAASSETTSCPSSSINANVPATAMVTTAADIADNARYDPATNVNGGPSPVVTCDKRQQEATHQLDSEIIET
jgi:hypothetical protein